MRKSEVYPVVIQAFADLKKGENPGYIKMRLNGWASSFARKQQLKEVLLLKRIIKSI
jgi:hypothetical protein